VGTVLKGVVTAVKPYGAFVDLGGMSGLIHISQISCDHSACRPFPSSPPLFLALHPCAPLTLPLSSTCLPPHPGLSLPTHHQRQSPSKTTNT
jgi:hypothetical protein